MKQRKRRLLSLLTAVTVLTSAALFPAGVSAAVSPPQEAESFTDTPAANPSTEDSLFQDTLEVTADESPFLDEMEQVPSAEAVSSPIVVGEEDSNYTYEVIPQTQIKDTATADSINSNGSNSEGPALYAFDGNTSTGWHTDYNDGTTTPHWIQWKLGGTYLVSKLQYSPKQGGQNGIWKEIKIEVTTNGSLDTATWTQVYQGTIDELPYNPPLTATINFTPTAASAMRVTLTDTYNSYPTGTTNKFGSAGEINVYQAIPNQPQSHVHATHDGGEAIEFQPLPAEFTGGELESGNYYLTRNVVLDSAIIVEEGKKINFCTNGYKITSKQVNGHAASYVFQLYKNYYTPGGNLNLCDCTGTGEIHQVNGGTYREAIHISSGTVNFYSGKITSDAAYGVYVSKAYVASSGGLLSVYGGEIEGVNSAVDVSTSSTANIYGGRITSTGESSAAVLLESGGEVNLSGGTVTSSSGYAVKANAACLNLSGNPSLNGGVADLYTSDDYIDGKEGNYLKHHENNVNGYTGGPLDVELKIEAGYYELGTHDVAFTNVSAENKDKFTVINEGYEFTYDETGKYLRFIKTPTPDPVIWIKVNGGAEVGGETLEAAVRNSSVVPADVTKLEIVRGVITDDYSNRVGTGDSFWMKDHLTGLQELKVDCTDGKVTFKYKGNAASSFPSICNTFQHNSTLKAVSLPGMTEIPQKLFDRCANLENVEIPDVEYIGMDGFYQTEKLTSIDMPKVKEIDSSAFQGCKTLSTVNMPVVETIWDSAFADDYAYKTIHLPSTLTYIGECAFRKTDVTGRLDTKVNVTIDAVTPPEIGVDSSTDDEDWPFYSDSADLKNSTLTVPETSKHAYATAEVVGKLSGPTWCRLPIAGMEKEYTVTFKLDSRNVYETVTITGSNASSGLGTKMPEPPVKEGYDFVGWNEFSNGTGKYVTAETPIKYDTSFYAIFKPHEHAYTYTAVDNGITESCTCGHSATATIRTENKPYTGEAVSDAVTITYPEEWQGEKPVPSYPENVTDVGEYNATITIEETTVTIPFTIVKSANTDALEKLMEDVEAAIEDASYKKIIPSVKATLESALEEARELMESDPNVLQGKVDSAYEALKAPYDSLADSVQGDITGLDDLIAKAEELAKETNKYTPETLEALTDAVADAKALLEEKGENALVEEVNVQKEALQDAMENLALIATPTPTPPVTTPSPTPKPPVITPNPTQKPLPDNVPGDSTWKGDSIVTPNGTEVKPDGSIVLPDGTELKPDADGTKPSISKDGTVTDTNGTSIKADGAIVLPGKDKADPKDDTIVTKSNGTKAPSYNPETGKVTVNEGNLVTHPGNMVQKPAAGSTVDSLGTITEPDGTKITSDGVTHRTDGGKISYEGEILKPAIPIIESVRATGNAPIVELGDTVFGAFGYDFVVGTREDCIVTKDYLQIQKNKLLTETDFWYLPKGTYYFYCHAWFRNENGIKVFSGWSNAYEFEVTATTPAKPQIIKATVKGRNVTVTYRKSKDATGYDIVLGSAVRKVNGEFRPVDYGSYVKKNIDKDTVQVTFKNVKPGTYYVGMHAFNRTSTNKTKVFSPWSNRKTIRIKK